MIAFVKGLIEEIGDQKLILDCGALGYEINVPMSVLDSIPGIGSEIKLYTYLNVREDEMSLFGFLTKDALQMFKLLLTVGGVGPKAALGVLSALSTADLRFAVLSGDAKALSRAPGIGNKTAQRIIMELKDKVSLSDGLEVLAADAGKKGKSALSEEESSAKSDAIVALTELGFSSSDALRAVSKVDISGKDSGEILKEALKLMGR